MNKDETIYTSFLIIISIIVIIGLISELYCSVFNNNYNTIIKNNENLFILKCKSHHGIAIKNINNNIICKGYIGDTL